MADVVVVLVCLALLSAVIWAVLNKPPEARPLPPPIDMDEAWKRLQRRRAGR